MKKLMKQVPQNATILTPKAMNQVTGGDYSQGMGRGTVMTCGCSHATKPPYQSPWVGEYESVEEMMIAIITRCQNGQGECNPRSI